MRALLITGGIVALLLVSGAVLAWKAVRQWTRKGPSKEALAHPSAPADLRLRITVEESTERLGSGREDYKFSEVKVVLSNAKGKAVESPDIHVGLNGVPLPLVVPTGNYYDRYPQYRLRDDERLKFAPDQIGRFTVSWGDAPAFPAAMLRLPKGMNLANFHVPESQPANQALEISWTDLDTAADLVIYRTLTFVDDAGNHGYRSGSSNSEDALREKIGRSLFRATSGKIVVPVSYLSAPGGEQVSSVSMEITATTEGKFTQPFLPGGSVVALRKLTLHVPIVTAHAVAAVR